MGTQQAYESNDTLILTQLQPPRPCATAHLCVQVRNGQPFITKVGNFDVELAVSVSVCPTALRAGRFRAALGAPRALAAAAPRHRRRVPVPDELWRQDLHKPLLTRALRASQPLRTQGSVLLCRQVDQPGIVAGVSNLLAADNVNISFMTVGRTGRNNEAIMAIGIDSEPKPSTIEGVAKVKGVLEAVVFKEVNA